MNRVTEIAQDWLWSNKPDLISEVFDYCIGPYNTPQDLLLSFTNAFREILQHKILCTDTFIRNEMSEEDFEIISKENDQIDYADIFYGEEYNNLSFARIYVLDTKHDCIGMLTNSDIFWKTEKIDEIASSFGITCKKDYSNIDGQAIDKLIKMSKNIPIKNMSGDIVLYLQFEAFMPRMSPEWARNILAKYNEELDTQRPSP